VPGFPAKRALKIIKNELGLDVNELFQSFDPQPLAAASLAQVHRAVLRTGEEVVVKVQRENLLDLFAIDLWNIKLAAWLADRFDPQTEATAANWKVR
jgi:predicted unusual protein kinase regulating ubiquinone biosynthesis (AarF/ABC1/UbiB family)